MFCLLALPVGFAYNDETIICPVSASRRATVLKKRKKRRKNLFPAEEFCSAGSCSCQTQGNNSTQALSTKIVFFGRQKRNREKTIILSKALVFHCFLVFGRIGEYISLDLF